MRKTLSSNLVIDNGNMVRLCHSSLLEEKKKKKSKYNQSETKRKHPVHPMCKILVVTSKILGTYIRWRRCWLRAMSFLATLGIGLAGLTCCHSSICITPLSSQMKCSIGIEVISIPIFVVPTFQQERKDVTRIMTKGEFSLVITLFDSNQQRKVFFVQQIPLLITWKNILPSMTEKEDVFWFFI